MAFTDDQFQWVSEGMKPVADAAQAFTDNQFQWTEGEMGFALDETAGVAAGPALGTLQLMGVGR